MGEKLGIGNDVRRGYFGTTIFRVNDIFMFYVF